MKYKAGQKREDGLVFWRHTNEKGDIWITQAQFDHRKESAREYKRKAAAYYYALERAKKPEDRNYFGRYFPHIEKYFLKVSGSGKPIYGTKAEVEQLRRQHAIYKKKFVEKHQKLPKTDLKIGDRHPTQPGLFVVYFIGNKPYFDSSDKLKEVLESRRRATKKRYYKSKKIRRERLDKLDKRRKRGDVDNVTGLIFWAYNRIAKEIWLDKTIYDAKHTADLARRKLDRQKKNGYIKGTDAHVLLNEPKRRA
jgi:hypothetical protein